MKNIYIKKIRILGAVIEQAKDTILTRYTTSDTLYGPAVIYTLFGDPALRIKYPLAEVGENRIGQRVADLEIYPNPLRFWATIKGRGKISVYNIRGEKVFEKMVDGYCKWNRIDRRGQFLPAGVYFLKDEKGEATKKVVILK